MSGARGTLGHPASRKHSILTELESFAVQLNSDELTVLCQVAHGLVLGRDVYGQLDAVSDDRDFVKEASEEVRDALIYLGAHLLRLQRLGSQP